MDKSAVHTRSPPPRVDNDGKDTRGVLPLRIRQSRRGIGDRSEQKCPPRTLLHNFGAIANCVRVRNFFTDYAISQT